MQKTSFKKLTSLFLISLICFLSFAESGVPGTFEDASHSGLKEVLELDKKLNPSNDELVIYYVRSDKDYSTWGLWTWAIPGGDGGAAWNYTQKWTAEDGIGYMRLHLDGRDTGGIKPVSSDGGVGLIVRLQTGWTKDCNDDRIWNINTSNKVVIFSGDQNTYAALPYKPSAKSAELISLDEINLTLSGKYAIDTDGGSSGFEVTDDSGKSYKIQKVYNTKDSENFKNNMVDSITIKLAEKTDISKKLTVNNKVFQGSASVVNTKLAVKMADDKAPAESVKLGCSYKDGTATFNLWAPTSSSATLNLYKKDNAAKPDYTVAMVKDESNGVWSAIFLQVDPDGFFYDFTLQNSKGTVTVLDPYAKSMAAFKGKGGVGRAAVVNMESAKALPKDGMATYVNLAKREDAVIYEMSVRDFTISPDSNVKAERGTYEAFIEKIPYLKELGITHVQLMPVVNFYYNDETNKAYEDSGNVNGNNYNWGYDPHNYFTPEGWYATDASDPYCRVRELRELINECHKAGIGVLLDVVYNHMASTQFLDDIVPGYYFRTDDAGKLKGASGCGNDTATERKMMKRLVVDSTSYWVENYKVDGFRFDIMGLMESSSVLDSYTVCSKLNPSVLFEGEAWKMYNGPKDTVGMDQNYMSKTNSVAAFNDEFRDIIKAGGFNETGRGFITNKGSDAEKLFRNVIGNPVVNYRADNPGDNLQYLVCHDGLTLHDGVAHNLKLDETKAEGKKEIIQRIKLGNFFELTSQGISFLHGGQERGRTKPNFTNAKNESIGKFVRNSYDSSDNINQIVWTLDDDYENLFAYTKGLISLRKSNKAFRSDSAEWLKENAQVIPVKSDDNLVFCYSIKDENKTWIIAVNAKTEKAEVNTKINLKNAKVFVDSEGAGSNAIEAPIGVTVKGKKIKLAPLTATVICVEK